MNMQVTGNAWPALTSLIKQQNRQKACYGTFFSVAAAAPANFLLLLCFAALLLLRFAALLIGRSR